MDRGVRRGGRTRFLGGLRAPGAKRQSMLLKRRPPRIDDSPAQTRDGFEHLDPTALAILRWLKANRVEFVLVGPVAEAIRGRTAAEGPASIVPAPYRRNLERLARALDSAHASIRLDGAGITGEADTTPTKMTAEKLARGQLWTLRCGNHDLDIDDLVVSQAHVGKGLVIKRFHARGRGRAGKILKPFSHLTIVVRQVEASA